MIQDNQTFLLTFASAWVHPRLFDGVRAADYFIFLDCIVRDRRGRDRMLVGLTTTYAISDYHHSRCEFRSRFVESDIKH